MSTVSERLTALGTRSTSTLFDTAILAQRQNAQAMQAWLDLLEANQQANRDIAARFMRQAGEATRLWQRFVQDATQVADPFAALRRARQLDEAVARLDALNQQVAAHAQRAEAAATQAEAVLATLTKAQKQVNAGAERAESAAARAQQIGDRMRQADEQLRGGVERAETAARRAQGAGDAAEKVNEHVTATARRLEATAEKVQRLSENGKTAAPPAAGGQKTTTPAAARRSHAKAAANTTAEGEQEAVPAPQTGKNIAS